MILKFLAQNHTPTFKFYRFGRNIIFTLIFLLPFTVQSYVQFESSPTDDWDTVFDRAGVERYYSVQKGDNLYDISKTLFGDSSFWPKIWSLNSKITNPHNIEKGQFIYFTGGTIVAPPRFGMETIQSQTYVYGSGLLTPEIPPGQLSKKPIPIPSSFPNYYKVGLQKEEEGEFLKSIRVGRRRALFEKRKIVITSEIVDRRPNSLGRVSRVQTGGHVARTGSIVSVKVDSISPEIGQVFSLFEYKREKISYRGSGVDAGLVEWLGQLKILKKVSENQYLAEVLNCNDLVFIGAHISNEEIISISLPNSTEDIDAQVNRSIEIIGANKAKEVSVIGEGAVVYLKGGRRAGISPNEVYPIFTNFGQNFLNVEKKYIQKSIGYVKVAKVNDKFSTGVVFNLSYEVSEKSSVGGVR